MTDWEDDLQPVDPMVAVSGSVRFHPQVQHLLVGIDNVTRHPDNPREGDVDAISESIEVNGFIAPVIVQKSTGHILAGNHRYDALLALGSEVIPVIQIDVDDIAAKRYLLADNRTSDLGRYNEENLLGVLLELSETETGLMGTGYDVAALEALLVDQAEHGGDTHRFGATTMTLLLVYGEARYNKVLGAIRKMQREQGLDTESDVIAYLLGVD